MGQGFAHTAKVPGEYTSSQSCPALPSRHWMEHIIETLSTGSEWPFGADDMYSERDQRVASVFWHHMPNDPEAAAVECGPSRSSVSREAGEFVHSLILSRTCDILRGAGERADFLDGGDQSQDLAWRMANAVTAISGALGEALLPESDDFGWKGIRDRLGEAYCRRQ